MSILKKNIVGNLLGRGWSGLISLAFIPIYINFSGIESYGLIGIFIMIQAFLSLLDLGLSATVNREMAGTPGLAGTGHRERLAGTGARRRHGCHASSSG